MKPEIIEILKNGTLTGSLFVLPVGRQLERKLYTDVAKALEGIGGKWSRKQNGFLFEQDPAELLADVTNGKKRNIKQETQFFETPEELAKWKVQHAYITPEDVVLEPEAGRGALIKAMRKEGHNNTVYCYELDPLNQTHLKKLQDIELLGADFLNTPDEYPHRGKFDKIIANPPFSNNQDIDHIYKMWEVLAPKGRIVTTCSLHCSIDTRGKKEKAFREFVEKHEGELYPVSSIVGPGAFKSSGTLIEAQVLILDKQ